MKRKLIIGIKIIFTVCLFFAGFSYLGHTLMRKAKYGDWNYLIKVGNFDLIEENTMDVLFFGSSHTYCSIDPVLLKEDYGIESYVLATQQQSLILNYHYIIEALKTQSPHTIVVELFMVGRTNGYQNDEILHDAIDVLPLSLNKIEMIQAAVPEEKRMEHYFPIIKYHSRWKELTWDDFKLDYRGWVDENRGYVRLHHVYPTELDTTIPFGRERNLTDQEIEYLAKIEALAQENDIRLIYLYAPYPMDGNGVDYAYTLELYAEEKGVPYINGYELLTELNYDGNTDFCDEFGHLNESGAKKLTEYLVDWIR